MSDEIAIGIDLGTSYSCVSVVQDGRPLVIPSAAGERTQASCVAFLDDQTVLVGNTAKRELSQRPEATVYSAERRIGRVFFSDGV